MGSDVQDTIQQWLETQILIYEGREGETGKDRTGSSSQEGRNERVCDAMIFLLGCFPKPGC